MESRNKTPESNKTTGSSPSSTNRPTTGTTPPPTTPSTTGHTTSGQSSGFASTPQSGQPSPTATSAQRARDENSNFGNNRSSEMVDQTRQAVSQAYDKTTETLSQTYNQAMEYGREHPGKLTLIAFGAGIGIGLLLAGGLSGGRSRTSRIAEPAIDAISRIAMEFFR